MSGLLAGLGTIFGGGAAAGAGIGATIVGGLLSSVGQAIATRSSERREEARRIAEERRREARYAGSGEAARIVGSSANTAANSVTAGQNVSPHKSAETPLGTPEPLLKGFNGASDKAIPATLKYNPTTQKFQRV